MGKILQGINKTILQPGIISYRKRKYGLPPTTIYSSDCSGGVLCHDFGIALDTPTVNLIIEGEDFLKFCIELEYYLRQPLRDANLDYSFPTAYCGDILIKGIHYHSFNDLESSWNRRKLRIHMDNTVFCLSANQITDEEMLDQFLHLDGRKIVFCPKSYRMNNIESECLVELKYFDKMFMFRGLSGHRYIEADFNYAEWFLQSKFNGDTYHDGSDYGNNSSI